MIIHIPPDVQYPDLKVAPYAGVKQRDSSMPVVFSCDTTVFQRILDFNGLSLHDLDDRQILPILEGMYTVYRQQHPEYTDPCGEFLSQWVQVQEHPGFIHRGGTA